MAAVERGGENQADGKDEPASAVFRMYIVLQRTETEMKHTRIAPPDYLKNYVHYFWTLESDSAGAPSKTFGALADGSPGIIFQQFEHGNFIDEGNKRLPDIFLYGQTTKPVTFQSPGRFSAIGVYFYPHALRSVFGFRADELTNGCMDVNLISRKQGFQVSEQLLNATSRAEQINTLSVWLWKLINKNNTPADGVTQYALSQIIKSRGGVALRELQEYVKLSERSLERRFNEYIGITPKLFSKICRFQTSLDQLRKSKYEKLSDIAYENDYADQSHFIRVFKAFAGISPHQYQKQSNEMVQNFPELRRNE